MSSTYEDNVIIGEYREYHYKIYLDAETKCLVGTILEFDGFGDCKSDSLTHLKEQIERDIDEDIYYKYHNQLLEENRKLREWAKVHNCEYPFKFGE